MPPRQDIYPHSLRMAFHLLMVRHWYYLCFESLNLILFFLLGMVSSIVKNQPSDWDYGCVFKISDGPQSSYRFPIFPSAYTNYIDDKLANCKFLFLILAICEITRSLLARDNSLLRNQLSRIGKSEEPI